MIKYIFSAFVFVLFNQFLTAQDWVVTEMTNMPMATTNNAVCEGKVNDDNYVYSFGGLDTSKKFSGIHQKCFRYSVADDMWESIPDLPDSIGKIASGASRVGDIIYIMGGYHVFSDDTEISSNKVHRYNTQSNQFIEDGENMPRAIDDHVQAVWKDSLIFLITGWSNDKNYPDVQVYNPYTNSWKNGTPVPNNISYTVFGGSGTIIGDTIYYFGGAKYTTNFPSSNSLVKGVIKATSDSILIEWTKETLSSTLTGYRMASLNANGYVFWLGGSTVTYNYDGIAYNNSGGVEPSGHNIVYYPNFGSWDSSSVDLPMDLRGIAKTSEYEAYIAGGMLANQKVSDKLYRLKFQWGFLSIKEMDNKFEIIFPNPADSFLNIEVEDNTLYQIFDVSGKELEIGQVINGRIELNNLSGVLFLRIKSKVYKIVVK